MAAKRGYRALKTRVKTALESAREGFNLGGGTRPDLAARLDEDMKSSPHSPRARKAAKGRAASKLGDVSRAKTKAFYKAFYDAQAKANRGMAMDSKAHAERAQGGVKYKTAKFKTRTFPGPGAPPPVRPTYKFVNEPKKKRKKPAGRRTLR